MPKRELNGTESTSLEVLAVQRAKAQAEQAQIDKQIEALTGQIDELLAKRAAEGAQAEERTIRLLSYVNDAAPEGLEIPLEVARNLPGHVSGTEGALVIEWADPEAPAETETVTTETETVEVLAEVEA